MSNDTRISVGDGGFYAVKPDGHLISAKALPTVKDKDGKAVVRDGWKWATAADVKAKADAEAERRKKEGR